MQEILTLLAEPFLYPFMRQAFLIGLACAVPAALLSCFLVLKGWSLLGDALSHAVLPGIVLAYILGIPLLVGAFAAGIFCALATGYLQHNSRIKEDTILGVVFSGMFGLGLVLFTKSSTDLHLDHILFGDLLGISTRDLIETGVIALFVCLVVLVKWRDLLLYVFDPVQLLALGLPQKMISYGFLSLIALSIVGALKSVGILLTVSMLIAPGAVAFLLTKRFSSMLMIASLFAALASFFGIYLSFYIDSSPAATIVLLQSLVFVLILPFKSKKRLRARPASLGG